MKAIAVVDKNWGIGKEGGLLFSLPADMKFFRETTTGATVVMGKKTLASFPGGRPLKNRTNIVIDSKCLHDGCVTVKNLDELFAVLKDVKGEVYVIGGAMTYRSLHPYCEEALITKVDASGGADVFLDNLEKLPQWSMTSMSEPVETNGYTIRFTVYRNNRVLSPVSEKK